MQLNPIGVKLIMSTFDGVPVTFLTGKFGLAHLATGHEPPKTACGRTAAGLQNVIPDAQWTLCANCQTVLTRAQRQKHVASANRGRMNKEARNA